MFPVPLPDCGILEAERIMCKRGGGRDQAWKVLWIPVVRLLRATRKKWQLRGDVVFIAKCVTPIFLLFICKAFLYIRRRAGKIALRALDVIVGPVCPSLVYLFYATGIVLSAVDIDIHDKLCLHLSDPTEVFCVMCKIEPLSFTKVAHQ